MTIPRWLLAAACAGPLAGAVPGVPEPGPGGDLPWLSLTMANDMFASGLANRDDFRTAGIDLEARWDTVVLSAGGSMLTDRSAGTRSDQLVALAGLWTGPLRAGGLFASAQAGVGVQVDQRLAGQDIQNAIHDRIGANRVYLAYDDPRGTRPAAGGAAVAGWHHDGLSLELVAAGSAVAGGESIVEFGPRLALIADRGALWAGPRLRGHAGDTAGPTVARTLDHEDGLWIDFGAWIAPGATPYGALVGWQARASYDPSTRASAGSIGLLVWPDSMPAGPAGDGDSHGVVIEHDLAGYGGGGLGVQVRIGQPVADRSRYAAVVLDSRYGSDPGGRMYWNIGHGGDVDADLRHDQVTIGGELGWRSGAWENLRADLAMQGAAGGRSEGVVLYGAGEQRLEARATAPVVRGTLLARLRFGRIFALGASLDGWLPWWRESVDTGTGAPAVLNEPGWAIGYHLSGRITW